MYALRIIWKRTRIQPPHRRLACVVDDRATSGLADQNAPPRVVRTTASVDSSVNAGVEVEAGSSSSRRA